MPKVRPAAQEVAEGQTAGDEAEGEGTTLRFCLIVGFSSELLALSSIGTSCGKCLTFLLPSI
jgi:hypothetical protein